MCHVTKYSTILGVFQQPWPGVTPTAILNEEKALGTRLPADVRRQVLKLLCPHLNEGESETLFKCVARLPNLPGSISFDGSGEFYVFS